MGTGSTSAISREGKFGASRRIGRFGGTRWPRILLGAYLIGSGTLLLLVLLEAGWRVARSTAHALGAKRGGFVPTSPADVPYTLHPYFQTLPPPDREHEAGPFLASWLVSPSGAAKAPGRFRVLFLGGSTTANAYPVLVREELEKSIGPTTAYNLGNDWHCSLHSLYKVWTYGDDIRPDLTIVLEGVNDFFRGFTPPHVSLPVYRPDYSHYSGPLATFWLPGRARWDGRPVFFSRPAGKFESYETQDESLAGLGRSIVRNSALLRALGVKVSLPGVETDVNAPAPEDTMFRALPDYERNMRNLVLSCRTKGFPLLLLTMPYTTECPPKFLLPDGYFTNDDVHALSKQDFARGMDRFNAATLALRDEPAVHVLPLADEKFDAKLFRDEVHFTPEGLREEARIVAGYVLEHRLLDTPRNR